MAGLQGNDVSLAAGQIPSASRTDALGTTLIPLLKKDSVPSGLSLIVKFGVFSDNLKANAYSILWEFD